MIYGYCRISTPSQNIERQIRNITKEYPDCKIIREVYTGTSLDRKEFVKLIKKVKQGDTIVFDSVSRMSRNASEGFNQYKEFFDMGIELVFLKEPHINTATYKEALKPQISMTGEAVDVILKGVNEYLMLLAQKQIKIAFEQAEKEVTDLQQRTKEGIETARQHGKQIGQKKGATLNIKKEQPAKEFILKHNKMFGGSLSNRETWEAAHISEATFYKYRKELQLAEAENKEK